MKIINNVNLKKTISDCDMIWDRFCYNWDYGPFLGNGETGLSIFNAKDNNELIIQFGNTSIYDNRNITAQFLHNDLFYTPRLPLGKFKLKGKSESFSSISMRLKLYEAMLNGKIISDSGKELSFVSFVPSGVNAAVFMYESEFEAEIEYYPSKAISPRHKKIIQDKRTDGCKDYYDPKDPEDIEKDGIKIRVQPKFNGEKYAVGYKVFNTGKTNTLIVSAANEGNCIEKVVNDITFTYNNLTNITKFHMDWWNLFYKKSFISIPDTVLENFYWIQMYKMASATRSDKNVFDTAGPWLGEVTAWPGTWWNLNVEVNYWSLYTSNHLSIAKSLINKLDNERKCLYDNVPDKLKSDERCTLGRSTTASLLSPCGIPGEDTALNLVEVGNLIWALHNCYTHYRMCMDEKILRNVIFPLLRDTINYCRLFLVEEDDRKLHLLPTSSPEYIALDYDCNYNLSLIKWGLLKLIEIDKQLNLNCDKKDMWLETLEKLTDFPYDEKEGFKIARDTSLAESHRHFSHLLMFFPLNILDVNEDKEKIIKSIEHWQSMPESLEGYSQTGASSMYSRLGNGEKSLKHINNLFDGFIRPNTMYKEGGNYVLETPPAAAASILDMMLLSYDDSIRVFPAIPNKWKDVVFDSLLAEGGFEISAERKDGKTKAIYVKSLCGEKCVIEADFTGEDFKVDGCAYEVNGNRITLNLKGGEAALIYTDRNELVISPVPKDTSLNNCFGFNDRTFKALPMDKIKDKDD